MLSTAQTMMIMFNFFFLPYRYQWSSFAFKFSLIFNMRLFFYLEKKDYFVTCITWKHAYFKWQWNFFELLKGEYFCCSGKLFLFGRECFDTYFLSFWFCTTPLLHGTSQTINKLHTNKATMKTIIVKIFYLFISIIQFLEKISNRLRKKTSKHFKKLQKTSENINNFSLYNVIIQTLNNNQIILT